MKRILAAPISLAALTVMLCLCVVAPPQMDSADALVRLEVARSIWRKGTIALEAPPNDDTMAPVGKDGRFYGLFPIGQSLLFVPLDIGASAVVLPLGESKGFMVNVLIAGTYLLLVNAALCAVTFKLLRRAGLGQRSAALGLAALFLTTQWLVWGRSTQEETAVAVLIGASILCWWKSGGGVARALAAGAALGLVANMRYNAVFAATATVAWSFFFMHDRKAWLRFWLTAALAALPWLILAAWYNWARFGSISSTGYDVIVQSGHMLPWEFKPDVLWGLIGGLDYGLLWFWPVLGFAAFATRAKVALACLGIGVLGHAVLLATYSFPPGGYGCVGPRYLCHQLLLILPFAYVGARRLWLTRRWRAAIVAVFGMSLLVQGASITLIEQLESMQVGARDRVGLETWPRAYIPARVANLTRLASGTLLDYSWPAPLGDSAGNLRRESYTTATQPNFLPWRVHGIRSSTNTSSSMQRLAQGAWLVATVAAALSLVLLMRRHNRRRVRFA